VVLAAKGTAAFVDPALEREARLVSAHGSLTADEMLVPVVAGRGRSTR
jgi:phosphohistidine swiveling domain-containing protein